MLEVTFNENNTSQSQNNDSGQYVIGVFLTKPYPLNSIVDFISLLELNPFSKTYEKIRTQLYEFSKMEVASFDLDLTLVCPIVGSQGSLKIPVRGTK